MPFQLIQMMSNGKAPPNLQPWAEEVLNDLLQILPSPAPGLTSYSRNQVILPKLIQVCQISYNIRLALAEDDICGNLQLLIYPPDTPFGRDEMRVPQVADGPSYLPRPSSFGSSTCPFLRVCALLKRFILLLILL